MKLLIDCLDGQVPKRGDIVQTNVGDRRERTCLVLFVRPCKKKFRFNVWAERWWQIDPDLRWRLFRSAERRGGQAMIEFHRYNIRARHCGHIYW